MLGSECAKASNDTGGSSTDAVTGAGETPVITTRFARADDIVEFFGESQHGTMQALVALIDDRVVGVIGIVREGPVGKYFADFSDELEPYLRSMPIMRVIKQSMTFCENYRGPLVSVAENAEGCRMLHRLGFTYLSGTLYGWLK